MFGLRTRRIAAVITTSAAFITLGACGGTYRGASSAQPDPSTDAAGTAESSQESTPTTDTTTAESQTAESATPATESTTAAAPPGQPGDVVAPFGPSVEFTGTVPGYEFHEDDVLEGFYRDFVGANGCTFEHRFVMAELLGSDTPLSDSYASQQALTEMAAMFAGWSVGRGPLPEADVRMERLPSNGSGENYEFWLYDGVADSGDQVRLASSYTPVPAADATWENWGVDYMLTCPSGTDMGPEWNAFMQVTQPHLYKNTDLP